VTGRGLALAGAAALTLAFASPAAAVPFTWTGAATVFNFSNTSNWSPAASPSGATSLTFGALSPACSVPMPADTCYNANNDVPGLSVDSISIDQNEPYMISGDPVTLGAGGLTVAPTGAYTLGAQLALPIVLAANQTWSINGFYDLGAVTGDSSLTIDARPNYILGLGGVQVGILGDIEVNAIELSGPAEFALEGGSLNGTDGEPVKLNGPALNAFDDASVGALSAISGAVEIGDDPDSPPATLAVNGAAVLYPHTELDLGITAPDLGITAPDQPSRLTASGPIELNGTLSLNQHAASGQTCSVLPLGSVSTLVSTPGELSGRFSNAPRGATVQVPSFDCPNRLGTVVVARIAYSPNSVTATIVATPAVASVKRWLDRLLAPTGRGASLPRLLKSRGYKFVSTPPGPGRVTLQWTARSKGKSVLVASAAAVTSAHRSTLQVKLTGPGRRLLRHAKKLRLTASASFAYPTVSASKKFTLKR
jgi:hypothetical protein